MTDSMNCKYCREDLSGKKYVKQEEKPFCVRCHDQFWELQHKGRYWHADCFRCYKCYKTLAKESFSAKDDGIKCGKCSSPEDAPRCNAYYKAILAGSENDCFTCFHCTDIYCNRCHEKRFAKICVSCKQEITTGGVNYQEQPWHSECFVCSSCRKPLAGTRFTSHEEKAFCVDCYKTTVAKKCFGKATNVVNYEGSSWHEYCFNCKKCSLSLANKRFVANAGDIFCSDCAKKL
uniref:Four and a half LIM domains 1b n=1 Tax=Hucho hucho TaxID=62062 RepID=A0A4W5N706_9TELE